MKDISPEAAQRLSLIDEQMRQLKRQIWALEDQHIAMSNAREAMRKGLALALTTSTRRTGPPVTAMEPTSAGDEFTGTLFPGIAARPHLLPRGRPRYVIDEYGVRHPMPPPGQADPCGNLSPARLSARELADVIEALGYDPRTGTDVDDDVWREQQRTGGA